MNLEFFRDMTQSEMTAWLQTASHEDISRARQIVRSGIMELEIRMLDHVEADLQDPEQKFTDATQLINRIKGMK